MKKATLLIIILISMMILNSTPSIDNLELENDIIEVNYDKKSAKLAILMSLIVPGAGSVYADHTRWHSYLFPIIDAALVYGYYYYDNKGHDQEKDYEKYVNGENITLLDQTGNVIYDGPRYNRDFQKIVQEYISDVNENDIYDYDYATGQGLYRLDEGNTQHFYEDVGKYDKYVYGWVDWYELYAHNFNPENEDTGNFMLDNFSNPDITWSSDDNNHRLLGFSIVNEDFIENGSDDNSYDAPYSAYRERYISMRKDAQKQFDTAENFVFGMLLNRAVSAVDAYFAVKKHNKNYLSQKSFDVNYYATMQNNKLTPMLFFTQRF